MLAAKRLASALGPLLRPRPPPAVPRALSTLLPGRPGAAGAAGLPGRLLPALGPPGRLLPALGPPGLPPALGFKTKGVIRERCRDCYRVKRRGRWFIYCRANPKHKQRQM
ncbi:39S ribosomal protein L36, mitochondrial [Mustela erminea]|uniref:39S ribosomal protein L36, mitochondrial n=1 Tax=Mustela erminea TaxID=36723 RepID=UPI00138661E2|nr:39S ribosomal protein L36, mitochondrial [Mustela erminea]